MKQSSDLKKRVHQGLKLRKRVKRQRKRFERICGRSHDGFAACRTDTFGRNFMSTEGYIRKSYSYTKRDDVLGELVPWSKMTKELVAWLEQTSWYPRKDKPWLIQLAECAVDDETRVKGVEEVA